MDGDPRPEAAEDTDRRVVVVATDSPRRVARLPVRLVEWVDRPVTDSRLPVRVVTRRRTRTVRRRPDLRE